MPIEPFELNLSLQEYFFYQECPQKFRLHRLCNPVPTATSFLSQGKRSYEHYLLRGYSGASLEGIELHQFFAQFHSQYYRSIVEGTPPPEIVVDRRKLLYWHDQQQRYQALAAITDSAADLWFPVATELPLMSEHLRGKIDCLEWCEEKTGGLRIVDYKRRPQPARDRETLLFYAVLANAFRDEANHQIYEISSVGCYYYSSGEKWLLAVTPKLLDAITSQVAAILEGLAQESFERPEGAHCPDCPYKSLCLIEQKRSSKKSKKKRKRISSSNFT